MDAKELLRKYFKMLYEGDWESLLAEDMTFTNNGKENPPGKNVYIEATKRFMKSAKSVKVKQLVVEGNSACALTSYGLVSPSGKTSTCEVAEFFTVSDGKIQSNSIIFDVAAFQDFMSKG